MEVQNLRKNGGLVHMAEFQAIHFNQNSGNIVQCYSSNKKDHVIIKESGNWFRDDDDLEDFESYSWPKTLAGDRHFCLPGACRICAVLVANGPETHRVHVPELLQRKDELVESSSEHQFLASSHTATKSKSQLKFPKFPLTTCIIGDISRGTQQVDSCKERKVNSQFGDKCNTSDTFSQQDVDPVDNDSLLIPIFLRHASGELVLNVTVGLSSEQLMHLYALKIKTNLEFQYLLYNKKILEPTHTLLFYGVQRDSTVHVCSRLLGGTLTTLAQYINENKSKFTKEVTLPTGQLSLQLTNLGCQFLSSWIKCFTTAFSKGLSWDGEFTMENFKYVDGHVRIHKKPKAHEYGAMESDLRLFIDHVEETLCRKDKRLISKYPPYLEHFKTFLNGLVIRDACLPNNTRLIIEAAVFCMTSFARERLIIELFRKYEGLDPSEIPAWHDAINSSRCSRTWYTDLYEIKFFKNIIDTAIDKFGGYEETGIGAFRFIRDIVMHGADYRKENKEKVQYDDGKELMIPAFFKDFLPDIINNLIMKNIDITAELEEAVQCACTICDSS